MTYTLDARFLGNPETAHPYLQEQLSLPEYYGQNLDALYDCISEMNDPTIHIIHADDIEGEQERSYYDRILQVLCDACDVTVLD